MLEYAISVGWGGFIPEQYTRLKRLGFAVCRSRLLWWLLNSWMVFNRCAG
jgi:hypothetical protein